VDQLTRPWAEHPRVAPALATFGPALVLLVLQQVFFPTPAGVFVKGINLGLLGALLAVGMGLIYRSNRIFNFAQGELGALPGALAVYLIVFSGLNYFLAAAIGLVAAVVLGTVIELAIIRRFFRAPRLILAVATIGLAQLLAIGALLLPLLWDRRPNTFRIDIPVTMRFEVGSVVFSANDVVAMVVAPLALLAVAAWLRFTDVGIAVRASAESADRANLLGVPVKRLQTVVWVVATVLSFTALFLRAGIIGLPFGSGFTFTLLLSALAALTLGRLTNLLAIGINAIALGILANAIDFNADSSLLIDPIIAAVIVVGLLLQRRSTSRADLDTSSTWQAAEEVRPVPRELARVPLVRWARVGLFAVVGAVLLALPTFLNSGRTDKASAILIFGIIGISVVILTGWSGQVSLGQMAFAGIGAALGAYSVEQWSLDLGLALLLTGLVGAAVALLVGLPALRLRGLFLAVITLAFALATSSYFLNPDFFEWVPEGRFDRPNLFGALSIDSPMRIYYLALGALLLTVLAVRGIRTSRTGRVLVALRENERGAQSFGVSVTRAKLTAFALSGFIAALGGCLLAVHQRTYSPVLYLPFESFNVFTATVVGGLGSLTGGVLGAVYLRGMQWFIEDRQWQLLASSSGVLLVLLIYPSGLGGLVFRLRDHWLRWVARRRGIVVPSLLADAAPPEPEAVAPPPGMQEPELSREPVA
jgi:branched-chain amino acid transport system permease protein